MHLLEFTRKLLSIPIAAALVATLAPSMATAAFPERPVTLVVPYAPGAGTDSLARALAKALQAHWNQTVLVTNVAGADGLIGSQQALKANDGHTMLLQIPQMLMWRWTMASSGVDIQKDFRLVGKIQQTPMAVAVPVQSAPKTVAELVAHCKKAAQPCTVGTATTTGRVVGTQFMDEAGVSGAVYVPYKGGAPMMNDLLGGHVSMGLPSAGAAIPQAKRGAIRILAVTSKERFGQLPGVPTLKELGYNVTMNTWYGLMMPKDAPQAAFDSTVAAIKAVSKDPALLENIRNNGADPVFGSPAEFDSEVQAELTSLGPVLEKFKNSK